LNNLKRKSVEGEERSRKFSSESDGWCDHREDGEWLITPELQL